MSQEFSDSVKNMFLLKNPQFLPYHCEILTKEGTHEDLILTKFRNDRITIVDFFNKSIFNIFDRVQKLLGHSVSSAISKWMKKSEYKINEKCYYYSKT